VKHLKVVFVAKHYILKTFFFTIVMLNRRIPHKMLHFKDDFSQLSHMQNLVATSPRTINIWITSLIIRIMLSHDISNFVANFTLKRHVASKILWKGAFVRKFYFEKGKFLRKFYIWKCMFLENFTLRGMPLTNIMFQKGVFIANIKFENACFVQVLLWKRHVPPKILHLKRRVTRKYYA